MRVGLVDGMFAGSLSANVAQENAGVQSRLLQWDRNLNITNGIIVFTDTSFDQLRKYNHLPDKKVFWIIEPKEINPMPYKLAHTFLYSGVDLILTHDKDLVASHPDIEYLSLGGSWLKDWEMHHKTKLVSMFISPKTKTTGHKLRHSVAETFKQVDIFGKPYTEYLPSKSPGLRPYAFSIIIENSKTQGWYTEKLIDCFSQATIPILWGYLPEGFAPQGVLAWDSLDELGSILEEEVNMDFYRRSRYAIWHNLNEAHKHKSADDRIFGIFKKRGWL